MAVEIAQLILWILDLDSVCVYFFGGEKFIFCVVWMIIFAYDCRDLMTNLMQPCFNSIVNTTWRKVSRVTLRRNLSKSLNVSSP